MNSTYSIRFYISTVLALLAFAGNSILCKMALGGNAIDPTSFTSIRLLSGIVVLLIITKTTNKVGVSVSKGSWLAATLLFVYAVSFSFGYMSLDTGIGALILFGSVQITMIIANLVSGNKLHYTEWFGLCMAFSGFVYLITPGISTPSLQGFVLMTLSGIAWALYTLIGRSSCNPLTDTAYNFLRTFPFVIIMILFMSKNVSLSTNGALLAVLSGGVASGIGYTVWYSVLNKISITQSAVIQLLVPIIAALGGAVLLMEVITLHLLFSSALVLGGVLMVILGRYYFITLMLKKK